MSAQRLAPQPEVVAWSGPGWKIQRLDPVGPDGRACYYAFVGQQPGFMVESWVLIRYDDGRERARIDHPQGCTLLLPGPIERKR